MTFGSIALAQQRVREKVNQLCSDKSSNPFQEINIAEVIIHPDYWSDKTKHGNSYDLALIQMDQVLSLVMAR